MKQTLIYFLLLNLLSSCSQDKVDSAVSVITPRVFVEHNPSEFTLKGQQLLYNNEPFSGYLFRLFNSSLDTLECIGYLEGKMNGISKKWHSPKQLAEFRVYRNGKKNGSQISYWPNGNKRFEFVAVDNKYEGKMEQWDSKGMLTQLGNYKDGHEFGEQKMWSANGKIRSNYIIKNGRRYGLLGTKNCVNVSDSIDLIK